MSTALRSFAWATFAFALVSTPIRAQERGAAPVLTSPEAAPLNAGDLDAWLSPIVREQLGRLGIAGAVSGTKPAL